jgi:hypothetical protein
MSMAMAVLAVPAERPGAQRLSGSGGPEGFAFSSSNLRRVMAAGPFAVLVATSSMDETFVSVRLIVNGDEVLRRSVDATARPTFDGTHIAWATATGITVAHVPSKREWAAWTQPEGDVIQRFCTSDDKLYLVAGTGGGAVRVVAAALDAGAATEERRLPETFGGSLELICSTAGALISSKAAGAAVLWRPAGFEEIPLEGCHPVALTASFVYCAHPSAISRRSLERGDWQSIYETTQGQIEPALSIEPDEGTVSFIERNDGRSAELVSVSTIGNQQVRTALPGSEPWDKPQLWALSGRWLLYPGQRDGLGWVFARMFPLPGNEVMPRSPAVGDPTDPTARGMAWLESQLGPRIVTRHGMDGRLIDSYEDSERAGWTYDAAVAAIAFTALQRPDLAKQLLAGLHHIQANDGSFSFAYQPDRVAPLIGEQYIGSMAWVVMAANFYEQRTGDSAFAPLSVSALDFIDRFVVRDPASPLDGGVSMGPVAPQTYSTEHNVDAFSAYSWRGRLSNRPEYLDTALRLQQFIFRELPATRPGAEDFHFKVGQRDASLYLDPQSWTTLAFASDGALTARLERALTVAERRLRVTSGRSGSVSGLLGFRDAAHADPDKVWVEGTEGMVAARLALGQTDLARTYHQQTIRVQTGAGGLPYASENAEGWSTRPSVAGTAWFLLNRTWPPTNPFIPDPSWWTRRHGDRPPMIPRLPGYRPAILSRASTLPGALP